MLNNLFSERFTSFYPSIDRSLSLTLFLVRFAVVFSLPYLHMMATCIVGFMFRYLFNCFALKGSIFVPLAFKNHSILFLYLYRHWRQTERQIRERERERARDKRARERARKKSKLFKQNEFQQKNRCPNHPTAN